MLLLRRVSTSHNDINKIKEQKNYEQQKTNSCVSWGGGDRLTAPLSHPEGVNPKGSSLSNNPKAGLLRLKPRNDVLAFTFAEDATHVDIPNCQRKIAFTLAEVLVTLGIIGVVAAMTMPALINNTNGKQLEVSFKTAYSLLSQAILMVKDELGIGLKTRYATYNGTVYPNAAEIKNVILTKMKQTGKCKYKAGSVRNYSKSTNNPYVDNGTPYPSVALANGMCMDVNVCSGEINITIDINGTKRPNVLGQDIFFFDIDENDTLHPKATSRRYTKEELEAMYPNGTRPNFSSQAGYPCSIKSSQPGNGLGCAYYAVINESPDFPDKPYFEALP